MDKNRFDGFTRQLAQRENRRQAIKTLLAGGAGTAAAIMIGKETEAAKPPSTSVDCCPANAPRLCGLTCTAVATDPNNCGACGVTCQSGQTCLNGACTPAITKCKKAKDCPSGQTCTNGVCTLPTPQCTSPNDCPPSSNECKMATCTAGACGFGNRPLGTPVSQQTPGDCLQNVCDGNGGTTSQPANDPPAGTGVCLPSFTCNNGSAVPQYAPTTTVCDGGYCNGTGTCVQCNSAANCPASDECKTAVCQNGTCGYNFVPEGTATSAQTAHDCKQNVCDGDGHIVSIADPTDLPLPQGECFTGICNGSSTGQQATPGVTCTSGVCDANGACVAQCAAPTDCPPTGNECVTRTCASGVCGTTNVASNTPLASQTPGDCHVVVCDGNGGTITQIDNTDKPASTDCTTGVCTNGVPSNPPVQAGTSCPGGVCDASGACVGCLTASDCAGTDTECAVHTCTSGVCGMAFQPNGTPTSNQTSGDCQKNVCDGAGNVISIDDNSDFLPPYYGNPCVDSICSNGAPAHPNLPAGTTCIGGGGVCDGSGVCVQCVTSAQCTTPVSNATPTCNSNVCSYICDAGYGDCTSGPDGCETNLMTDPNHCNGCGNVCNLPNATAGCSGGTCIITACNVGWGDCDANPANGCEANLNSDANCGTCGNKCGSGTKCTNGQCIVPFD